MDDKLCFESKLTEEEVQKNFEGMDFFSEVMSGLEEALDHAKGKTRSTTMICKRSLPDIDVAAERKALNPILKGSFIKRKAFILSVLALFLRKKSYSK